MDERDLFEDLADAIVTGRPVDWDDAEQSSPQEIRALLHELRVVAGIAELHRGAQHLDVVASATPEDVDRPAHRWGPLRLLEQLGTGASGVVYRAWDERLSREVALKLIHHRDTGLTSAVLHEGRLLARIRHPNVVTVYGAEEFDGRAGLWMELVGGETLDRYARRRGALPAAEVVEIVVALCGALQAVHDAGLLHRDLKAQNVMREPSGRIVLMDFHAGRDMRGPAAVDLVGTPMYLAPEILLGDHLATPQSDVYGAAALTFWLLTRAFPVTGRTVNALRASHRNGTRVSVRSLRPELPDPLTSAVDRALSRTPADRPASARAFAAQLADALQPNRAARTPKWWWAAAAALIVACASAVSVALEPARDRTGARSRSSAAGTLTMSELDWKDFIPLSAPTPDGRYIAGNVSLEPAVRDLATGQVTIVQRRAAEDDAADAGALSVDGRFVAYGWNAAQPDGSSRVEVRVSEVGAERSRVVLSDANIVDASVAAWTPDSRSLVAVVVMQDTTTLSLVDLQSGHVSRLYTFTKGAPLGVSLSPDGTTVAFDEPTERDGAARDIRALDLLTGRTRGLVVAPGNDLYPCWLPNGRAIAFASDRGGTLGLWRIDVADGASPQLVKDSMGRFAPIGFTADGDLYFRLQGTVMDLYRWTLPTGSDLQPASQVLSTFVGQNLDGDWSADGHSVVYVSRRGDVPFTQRSMSLMVRDLDTGRERRFTPDADGVHDPRWAPDGKHVIFNGRVGAVDRLQVLSAIDGTIAALSPPAAWMLPQWSRDGRRLYGAASRDGQWGIRVRDLATGRETELAWPTNMMFAVSHDERWLATTLAGHQGTAVMVRATSGGPWQQALDAAGADRISVIGWTPDDMALLSWRRTGMATGTIATEFWATPISNGVPGPPAELGVLPGLPDARKFRLSPDGRELLFTAGSSGFSSWVMKGIE